MVLMVLETEALADAALPVAQLAAHMRLPDGYASVAGQEDRLRLRLRAAIGAVEKRLARMLIAREAVLAGPGGTAEMPLPVGPVETLVSVETRTGGLTQNVPGGVVEDGVLVLPSATSPNARVTVVVRAGFGDWDAVPAELAQVVLTWAEALDLGEALPASVEALMGPWRSVRLRGAV